jgi:hypothetical protein
MRRALSVIPLLLAGCKVVDAPDALEELVVYGFVHFDDDIEYLEAMGEKLFPAVAEHEDELAEGYFVDLLTAGDLTLAGVEDAETEGIIGALGRSDYTHDLDAALCGISWPDKANTEAFESYLEYTLEDDGNLDCFLARECERYDSTATQRVDAPILGEAVQSFSRSFRWVEPRDTEPYVVSRLLAPEPIAFETEILAVDQQYSLVVLYPDGQATRRLETFWVEARALGFELPEAFAVSNAVNTMQNQADEIDAFIDGGEGCD